VVPPYVVKLSFMRDPQDRLQLSLPINTYPQPVKMKVAQFQEGTRVLTYMIRGEENTYIQHVFTGNLLRLQPHATLLMRDIQLYVELTRPCTESGAYSLCFCVLLLTLYSSILLRSLFLLYSCSSR